MGVLTQTPISDMEEHDVFRPRETASDLSGTVVEISNLHKSYRLRGKQKSFQIFRNLNLTIRAGSFVAFLGASGCGKSTLLRMIGGLDRPDKGEILLTDPRVSNPKAVLMLQQYPSLPWLSVLKNVEMGIRSSQRLLEGESVRAQALSYLSRVGLFGWENALPKELSGGMLQRLALARTLAMQPDVVLLDEPLGALDAFTRSELQNLIRERHSEEKKTFIMVTHDVDEALAVADRIIVLGAAGTGIVYDSATSSQTLDRAALIKILRGTSLTIAGGNLRGVVSRQISSKDIEKKACRLWLGTSDAERANMLLTGSAAGAIFTLPALAELAEQLAPIEPTIVFEFSQPTSVAGCPQILYRSGTVLGQEVWALPRVGPEQGIVRRTRDGDTGLTVVLYNNPQECIRAVACGEATHCICDNDLARSYVRPVRQLAWKTLPEEVCRDLYTVLVVPKSIVSEDLVALRAAIFELSTFGDKKNKHLGYRYVSREENYKHMETGELAHICQAWKLSNYEISLKAVVPNP